MRRQVRQLLAIGLNYVGPCRRIRHADPKEPIIFNKAWLHLRPQRRHMMPKGSTKLDWEVELSNRDRQSRPVSRRRIRR